MATESARAVPNAKHTHEFTVGAASIGTTNLASSVYAATGTIAGAAPDDTADGGLATTLARGDHRHAAPCAAPGSIAPDDAAAEGNSTSFARANHVHGITCATAADLTETATSSEGVATSFARSDHVHATAALAWGVLATRFASTGNGGPYTTSTTDMTVTLSVVAGRAYRIFIKTALTYSNSTPARFQFNCHVGGTRIGTFDTQNVLNANDLDRHLGGFVSYYPSSSASVTIDLRTIRVAGAGDVTLIHGAEIVRRLEVVDMGLA